MIGLLGLVECEGRRTLRGLLGVVGEKVSLGGLSRFFNRWQWSVAEVVQTGLNRFREQLAPQVQAEHHRQRVQRKKKRGHPQATVVTGYLIVDDSLHLKVKGRKMKGLGQHYSNIEGRVLTGHCLFSGLYVLLGRRCPLQPRLYRPKAVCEQEGVPFLSKIDLALQEIEQFEPVPGSQPHLLLDSWFHCKKVRRAAQKRGWDVSGGLKRNRLMRRVNPAGSRTWLKLAEYAAGLKATDWQRAVRPASTPSKPGSVNWVRPNCSSLATTRPTRPSRPAIGVQLYSTRTHKA